MDLSLITMDQYTALTESERAGLMLETLATSNITSRELLERHIINYVHLCNLEFNAPVKLSTINRIFYKTSAKFAGVKVAELVRDLSQRGIFKALIVKRTNIVVASQAYLNERETRMNETLGFLEPYERETRIKELNEEFKLLAE